MTGVGMNPLEPCHFDPQGFHEWDPVQHAGTGDPMPGARICANCGAFDAGPAGIRVNHRDSPIPLFPAGTRSYRQIETHNPDDPSPTGTPGKEGRW